ncbi:aldolase/citrate lyase family protein [Isoptericola sp. NPDC019482]|uniref:aldolase/citrate lyase family protein n=1 Tax=Isoptericola sp. NPDC019482 TaxID=3154688 RepID=UPI003488E14D
MRDDGRGGAGGLAAAGAEGALTGLWLAGGSPLLAETCADSGLDLLLVDTEYDPRGTRAAVQSAVVQVRATRGYPVTTAVRAADDATLRALLEAGVHDLVVPVGSVDGAQQVAGVVRRATGGRGTVLVQVGTPAVAAAVADLVALDGVSGVLLDAPDLAAALGRPGHAHPDVVAAALRTVREVRAAGGVVGVDASDPLVAEACREAGASFVVVGTEVTLLARGLASLPACPPAAATDRGYAPAMP